MLHINPTHSDFFFNKPYLINHKVTSETWKPLNEIVFPKGECDVCVVNKKLSDFPFRVAEGRPSICFPANINYSEYSRIMKIETPIYYDN